MPICAAAAASSASSAPSSAPPAEECDAMTAIITANTRPEFSVSRRAFGIGAVSVAAGLAIGFRWAAAQAPQGGPPVPPMIRANPQLDGWVRIAPDGSVTVMTGRVEIGQGVLTVMRQVAAEELDVAPER